VEDFWAPAAAGPASPRETRPLLFRTALVRATGCRLKSKRPAEAGLLVRQVCSGMYPWWEVEEAFDVGAPYCSPRCRSSQRSSRLLMNELLDFPDFFALPPDFALAATELRMVAK
jgi:hypothetical protein